LADESNPADDDEAVAHAEELGFKMVVINGVNTFVKVDDKYDVIIYFKSDEKTVVRKRRVRRDSF
jgi:hypothetical protein